MVIGVLREIKPNEYRVAVTPAAAQELVKGGHRVMVEFGAGAGSGFSDEDYQAAGAELAEAEAVWAGAELVCKVKEIFPEEFKYLRKGMVLMTYIHSNAHREETDALLQSGVTAIAYEDVMEDDGQFPLLAPMSDLAGRGGFLAALQYCQSVHGGTGMLLCNVCGVNAPQVTILGAGHSGMAAAELAAAFGNRVNLLDVSSKALQSARSRLPKNVDCLISDRANLERCLAQSDVVMNCIQWPKARKDHVLYRKDLALMKPGALIVDVACDDNGAVETCLSTTHDNPIYVVDGIRHYCVDNIPSAFAHTASVLLCNATLPYFQAVAGKGVLEALRQDVRLRRGLTCHEGLLTLKETADKQNRPWTDVETLF